jgi:hypothetical protein
VEECATWLCLFYLLCEKVFVFLCACLCCATPILGFFNVFSFNFLKLHQYEHW